LAQVAALSEALTQLWRKVVAEPAPALPQELGVVGADLFLEFAACGGARALALVDASLRHLPGIVREIDALRDEHLLAGIEQHDTHPAPVAQRRRPAAGLAHLAAVRARGRACSPCGPPTGSRNQRGTLFLANMATPRSRSRARDS